MAGCVPQDGAIDELDDSRVMFGYVRCIMPDGRPKFVAIIWAGPAAWTPNLLTDHFGKENGPHLGLCPAAWKSALGGLWAALPTLWAPLGCSKCNLPSKLHLQVQLGL